MSVLLFTRTTAGLPETTVSERILIELELLEHPVVVVSTEDDGAAGGFESAISWRDAIEVQSAAREVDGVVYQGSGGDNSDVWRSRLPGIVIVDTALSPVRALTTIARVPRADLATLGRRLLDVIGETDVNLARRAIAISLGTSVSAWGVESAAPELAELVSSLRLFEA